MKHGELTPGLIFLVPYLFSGVAQLATGLFVVGRGHRTLEVVFLG